MEITNESLGIYLTNHPWLFLIIIWVVIWKALALWQSARRGQKIWFAALLIVNTLGLLEIIYLAYYYFKGKRQITPDSSIK